MSTYDAQGREAVGSKLTHHGNIIQVARRSKSLRPPAKGDAQHNKHESSLILNRTRTLSSASGECLKKRYQADAIENYFMSHDTSLGKTSKKTLAKLRRDGVNGLPHPELFESLLKIHKPFSSSLIQKHVTDLGNRLFPRFKMYLKEGFNIMLYGVGSKRECLQRFRNEYLSGEHCVLISGFQSTVGIRQILNVIVSDVLQLEDIPPPGAIKRLEIITDLFSRPEAVGSPLYLLLNSIDGKNLRTVKAQAILARLAAVPHIHMIATMDNNNLPLLWSPTELTQFSWVWEECTTLAAYSNEAGYANSRLLQSVLGGSANASSQLVDGHLFLNAAEVDVVALTRLRHVMASLTQNARDIFRLLVEYNLQALKEVDDILKANSIRKKKTETHTKKPFTSRELIKEDSATQEGMPLEELYWRCRDAFLANSEVTLRAQLAEFKDHKLVKFSKRSDGTELLKVPLDQASLREIIDNKQVFS